MSTEQGKRTHKLSFRVTETELEALREKMKLAGFERPSVYLRKMVMDGYVLRLDFPEMREMISLMRYSSNNLNQIAKKLNGTGEITREEIQEIQAVQEKIWSRINRILKRLGEIP